MFNPLVSIIIPVYNVEPYLEHCLESIINQTYKNLQIIIVNDGSTDNSPAICDKFAEKDNRIVVIHKKTAYPPQEMLVWVLVKAAIFYL